MGNITDRERKRRKQLTALRADVRGQLTALRADVRGWLTKLDAEIALRIAEWKGAGLSPGDVVRALYSELGEYLANKLELELY